ncbi:N-acetylmuramoyl-L-alanine amidase [Pseudomonas sp. Marseille-P9899]|uniref:N-acetylmuramoyl-L-alanine amidase n=1 Tax=Pseudomonas sp. Marseille-P9899 TaxID=2730401 RepID=UPI00158E8A71|nr:N-acetylmuramoyl-L-alanine amidase [Pseudomonas sp. Marseille-P9899]
MYELDCETYRSTSFNRRVRFLVIHYTALDFQASVSALTGAASAHYLVPDPSDQSYQQAGFIGMRVFNLVDECERAWHAGLSQWAGRTNLNDTSIGIELVNQATDHEGTLTFVAYNPQQIEVLKELVADILRCYPDITPTQVVGHSDIALGRKNDPGAMFPWQALYEAGIGAWYDTATQQRYLAQFIKALPTPAEVIAKLGQYGYDTAQASTESGYRVLIRAFQLHFRQRNYDGLLDAETAAILYALVEKYFPSE